MHGGGPLHWRHFEELMKEEDKEAWGPKHKRALRTLAGGSVWTQAKLFDHKKGQRGYGQMQEMPKGSGNAVAQALRVRRGPQPEERPVPQGG